jgi:hypothetical protein
MFGFGTGVTRLLGGSAGSYWSFTIVDSGGVRVIRTVQDSAGTPVVRVTQDSSGQVVTRRADSTANRQDSLAASMRALVATRDSALRRLLTAGAPPPTLVMRGGLLTSGLVTVRATLDAFFAGRLTTYQDAIAMTKTTGWK